MRVGALARGGIAGVATLLVEKGAALALVIVLARVLDPQAFGLYSFVAVYLTVFQVLAEMGTEPVLLRRLAQQPERRAALMANALALRFTLALMAGIAAIALVGWVAGGGVGEGAATRAAVAAAAGGLLLAAQPCYRALLRTELRLEAVLGITTATSALMLALVAAAVALDGGVIGVFAALTVATFAGLGLAGLVARGSFRFRLAFDAGVWGELMREAWPVGGNLFLVLLVYRIPPLLLMRLHGPVEVGEYTAAARLIEASNLIADGVMMTVLPLLARLAVDHAPDLKTLSATTARFLGVAFLSGILLLTQIGDQVMALVFGAPFADAGSALAILSVSALLSALGTLYSGLLVATGRQRVLLALHVVSLIFLVPLQIALVRRFGLSGAATGVTVAAAVNHSILYLLPTTASLIRPCVHALAAPAALAAVLLLVGTWLPLAPLARGLVLPVVFVAVLVAAGRFGTRDLAALRAIAARHAAS